MFADATNWLCRHPESVGYLFAASIAVLAVVKWSERRAS